MRRSTLRADLLLLLTAAIWGFAFAAQRAGMEHVGPFTYTGVRFALGSLSLAPLVFRGRAARAPGAGPSNRRLFLLGGGAIGLVLFAAASLQQVGLLYTTAGKAGFITGLYVVIVPFFGILRRHRLPRQTLIGAGLAAAGLYFLSVTEALRIEPGDLLVLIGAIFWSAHVLLIGWLSPQVRPVHLACYQFGICSALALAVAFCFEPVRWSTIRAAALPILYGGVLSVGIAYTLQVVAQREAHPAHASILMSLESVFAALGGWLVLGERLSPRALIGCALMLAGMLAAQSRRPASQAGHRD